MNEMDASERDAAYREACGVVAAALKEQHASAELVDYVGRLGLYYKVMHMLSAWSLTAQSRREIATTLSVHVAAMKLLDDINDEDTAFAAIDLGLATLRLQLMANARLAAQMRDMREVLEYLDRSFASICTAQRACKLYPAQNGSEWREYAHEYGGRFLSVYGWLGGRLAGLESQSVVSERFAFAFGMIITIADDLTDYNKHNERDGNLGHLLKNGSVAQSEVVKVVGAYRTAAITAATVLPTACDLAQIVDHYATDVIERILPGLSE